jgi:cytidylate kinase
MTAPTQRARPVVAIDGPAGSGKSTVTARVADTLGYLRLGTGALYRAVALAVERQGASWEDEERVGSIAHAVVAAGELRVQQGSRGEQRVLLGAEDVTELLLDERMGGGASRVSAQPAVREALLELQRQAGRDGGIVAEGRDVGTVVFPDAEAKFFLTASVTVRAERRYRELLDRGTPADLDAITRDVAERDARDAGRSVAPLRQAADAELVDSSALGIEAVVDRIVERVRAVERQLAAQRTP